MKDNNWNQQGATLSHKTAMKEYGLTWEEILVELKAGKLQYREASVYGSPFYRLLRSEIEALVRKKLGKSGLLSKKKDTELKKVKSEIRSLSMKITALKKRQEELQQKV